jgi:uncharacterized protein (TIGR02118 family)
MFKAIILLTRRDDMSHQEFADWWLGPHADLARDLPGLRRLVQNLVSNDETGIDGVTELWFDTRSDFEAAYASDHGRRVAEDSIAHVSRRERLLVDERPLLD